MHQIFSEKEKVKGILQASTFSQEATRKYLLQINDSIPESTASVEMDSKTILDALLLHALLATKNMDNIEGEEDLADRFRLLAGIALDQSKKSNNNISSRSEDVYSQAKLDGQWAQTPTKFTKLSSEVTSKLAKRKKIFKGNNNSAHLAFWGQIALTSLVGTISYMEGIPPSGTIVGIFAAFTSLGMFLSPTIKEANVQITKIESITNSLAAITDQDSKFSPQYKFEAIKQLISSTE